MLSQILKEALQESGALADTVGVWLFGSAVARAWPRDLDLLYVYALRPGAITRAMLVRQAIGLRIRAAYALDADVTLLSRSEVDSTDFIRRERGVPVLGPGGSITESVIADAGAWLSGSPALIARN